MKKTLAAICFVSLAGCQTTTSVQYAYKPNTTVAQKDRDILECEVYATRMVSPNVQIAASPAFTTPTQTNCYRIGNSVQCQTTGGQAFGGQTYSYDANAALRQDLAGQCLGDRGYSITPLPTCPPDSVTPDIRQRLSGRLQPAAQGACVVQISNRSTNALNPSD